MDKFKRARSEQQVQTRLDEIINACEEIYDKQGYEAVNVKAIGEKISCTRPAIYKYFHTKEEIMMEILSREFVDWKNELEEEFSKCKKHDKNTFITILSTSLQHRMKLLELMSLRLEEIENGCRLERLVSFKQEAKSFFEVLHKEIHVFFPKATHQQELQFTQSFMTFIHGVYSYSHKTDKQMEASKKAGMKLHKTDFDELCFTTIKALTTLLTTK